MKSAFSQGLYRWYIWRKFYVSNKLSNRFKGTKYLTMWPSTSLRETIEQERYYLERDRAVNETVSRLEEKYADRGLKFSAPFYGGVPVQANGMIDGLYFYFRFRHDNASLRVGPYDQEVEDKMWQASERDRVARAIKRIVSGTPRDSWAEVSKPKVTEPGRDFYPTVVHKVSHVSNYTGEEYAGFLDAAECFDIFSKLVDNMVDVPESEWIDPLTQAFMDNTREEYWASLGLEFNPFTSKKVEPNV